MTIEVARERVAKGVALLDEKRPGWEHRVNVCALDLQSECRCVIAQLEGHFRFWTNVVPSGARLFTYGFDSDGSIGAFGLLQAAWLEAIAERVTAAPSSPGNTDRK